MTMTIDILPKIHNYAGSCSLPFLYTRESEIKVEKEESLGRNRTIVHTLEPLGGAAGCPYDRTCQSLGCTRCWSAGRGKMGGAC